LTGKEMTESTGPLYRLYYNFMSFMSLSAEQRGEMNLSSQLIQVLRGLPGGQEYIARKAGKGIRKTPERL